MPSSSGSHHRNLYVNYLCKLLTYYHQISIAGASYIDAPADRFTPSLTYFWGHTGQNVKVKFSGTTVAQIITPAHRHL